jgi:PiT family inorganic phosphate transporter
VDGELIVAIGLAAGFAVTNGLHDASNAIAALVATRAATPLQAIILASVCNILGPLLVGAAVADTIAGIVTVAPAEAVQVIGAGLAAATAWNLLTWRLGLPSSSGHALVGGLVGAALAAGGAEAVRWGGFDGIRPVGVIGTLAALAVSPVAGGVAALAVIRAARRLARRATRRWQQPVLRGEWGMSAALAFSHGANDAQKSVGLVAALLLAGGQIETLAAPTWATLLCAVALTVGTALGGWRIIRTVGRGIYRIGPLGGLASQTSSAAVIFGSSLIGAPVSTTQVVASSVIGVGAGRRQ